MVYEIRARAHGLVFMTYILRDMVYGLRQIAFALWVYGLYNGGIWIRDHVFGLIEWCL